MADDAREAFMEAAWAGFMAWAIKTPEVVQRFREETGSDFLTPMSPIDIAIDKATGRDEEQAIAFMCWATETLWGVDEAPEKVRAEIAKRGRR